MSEQKQTQKPDCPSVVYVVMCYQDIVGVYVDPKDAFNVQLEWIQKNRPASMKPFSVCYPQNK